MLLRGKGEYVDGFLERPARKPSARTIDHLGTEGVVQQWQSQSIILEGVTPQLQKLELHGLSGISLLLSLVRSSRRLTVLEIF